MVLVAYRATAGIEEFPSSVGGIIFLKENDGAPIGSNVSTF